ncbi:MAG: hypothetical protein K6T81_12625 [Alicyclobacillus macrosporangiidus]|nr:hypothetical protein [Alicyclobacillus macrosporangiidus]
MKKSVHRTIWPCVSALAVAFVMAGCGGAATGANKINPQSPINALPSAIQTKLSSFDSRKRTVHTLPTKITAQNVLYIAPNEKYAIDQFVQVWPRLKVKPAVVWTRTSEALAKTVWVKEGYKSNPLPSPQTQYVEQNLPTPDAYHQTGKDTWVEVPGVLTAQEVDKWLSFFQ